MLDRHETEHKSLDTPDETRKFPHGRAEIVEIGGGEIGRLVFEPGWRWSNDVKPIAGTDSCEAPHFQYHISGRLESAWMTGPSSPLGQETSRPFPVVMMPGWSETNLWLLSTGTGPATTRRRGRPCALSLSKRGACPSTSSGHISLSCKAFGRTSG